MMRRLTGYAGLVLAAVIFSFWALASSFAQTTADAPAEAAASAAETPAYIFPESGPFNSEKIKIENFEKIQDWLRSPHADLSAEAFSHWNEDGEIPEACSVCHSGAGFRAFHGFDGSERGVVEHPMPIGGVVDCETCHNPGLATLTEVTMPSGVSVPVVGVEGACMTCHQGRESGVDVAEATKDMGEDAPNPELGFINPHYRLAAATRLGGYGMVGYQYEGKTYSGLFRHSKPINTCVSCHDPHTLDVQTETCATCHFANDPEMIRVGNISFDGSGDLDKGIKDDIDANADKLMKAFMAYAESVAGVPMIYNGDRYPYFFADANGDGTIDQTEEGKVVTYNSWTPRLLKAAFNWKVVTADPGIYAHNPYYALELLYDSTEDIASAEGMDVDMGGMMR